MYFSLWIKTLTESFKNDNFNIALTSYNKGERVLNISKPNLKEVGNKILVVCHNAWKRIGFLAEFKGFFKTPCFYYGAICVILLALVYFGINRFPKAIIAQDINYLKNTEIASLNPVFTSTSSGDGTLFFTQDQQCLLEPPELNIIQNECLAAVTTPRVLSPKVFGAMFGQGPQIRKEITEYGVQEGDTLKSIALKFDISLDTLLLANNLTKTSKVKIGQQLVILPVTGLVHFVKSGDTVGSIAKVYKANADEIIEANELTDESDVYIGDILVVPNGVMPKKAPVLIDTNLADNYFIFPVEGRITQVLHWYNGVDIANKCGTPVFAAAAGKVVKAKYGWNGGGGNVVTILHKDGVVSYYGHLETISVNPGDQVDVGQKIGLIGGQPGMDGAGISTGCHLHFTIIGAKNPFRSLPLGYQMKYAQ